MTGYDELDKAILASIERGNRQFYLIHASVEKLTEPHALKHHFRVTDRRLQALRKRGLIEYGHGEWSLTPPAALGSGLQEKS